MLLADALVLRKALVAQANLSEMNLRTHGTAQITERISAIEGTGPLVEKAKAALPDPSDYLDEVYYYNVALLLVETAVGKTNATVQIGTGTLAEALFLRKGLKGSVDLLAPLLSGEVKVARRTDVPGQALSDVVITAPLVNPDKAREMHGDLAKRLRTLDSAIQRANWATEVELPEWVSQPYKKGHGVNLGALI